MVEGPLAREAFQGSFDVVTLSHVIEHVHDPIGLLKICRSLLAPGGQIWIGVHKTGGAPALWTSNVGSGQSFIRTNDPQNPMGLLPTKRTPMLRLELAR